MQSGSFTDCRAGLQLAIGALPAARRSAKRAASMVARQVGSGRVARLAAAFAAEQRLGLRLSARVRVAVVAVLAVWVWVENPVPRVFYLWGYLLAFAALGYAPLRAERRAWRALLPLLDQVLLACAIFLPSPGDTVLPAQMTLRFGNESFVFVLIVASVFTYSPAMVLWTGICAALVWSAATLWLLLRPDTVVTWSSAAWNHLPPDAAVAAMLDPHRVNPGLWGRLVVLFLVTAAALAVFVRRSRQLVERQAEAERERANLSRYFSPNQVEELAQSDTPLGATRQQEVAVLFADLVGFTSLAEAMPPADVIALLREFHGRMQEAVFAHGGTVDKYVGDALMATFGTPHPGPHDATQALRCARAMGEEIAAWNRERAAQGAAPLRIGIGAHYGPVVLGDIGGASRLEFAVLGDTVNVASRLERLTRTLNGSAVVSDALLATARREGAADLDALLAGFRPAPTQALRGRSETVAVWMRA
jgi:adenylate cyclase